MTKNEDLQQKRIRELTEELEAVKKELAVQVKVAEGAKRLVLHLNGELRSASLSEDEDELAEAGEATEGSTRRSSIIDRRGSIRDEALLEAYDDEAGDAASALATADEVALSSLSQTQILNSPPPRQHPQSTPASLSRNQ